MKNETEVFCYQELREFFDMIGDGSLTKAGEKIGCSRRAIYNWIEQGEITEICTGGPTSSRGKNWHKIIRRLGFNPKTLKRIQKKKKKLPKIFA